MQRVARHLLFWGLYYVQNVLLIFLVNTTRLVPPASASLRLAIESCLLLLLPKLLFTYFLFAFRPAMSPGNAGQRRGIAGIAVALLATLLLYRALSFFVIDPYIYRWRGGLPLLHPLGLLVALMDIGFVAGAALAIRQYREQRAAREREQELAHGRLETELRFLRQQTNPHFLFNTLNNIYALARKKSDQTPEVVVRLSKLLRFMLYESARPRISIDDELRLLDDYIELEKMRYDSRLTVNFYREIDNAQEPVSPLLLLPLVENAFKHGPGDSHRESYIHIDLLLKGSLLTFAIENSTENASATALQEGIGLSNVQRQLELLYSGYDLSFDRQPGLFTVTLTINLKTHAAHPLPVA
ncbi:sensor histidine kinase [Flaviaesturariibacter terrae]